MCHIIKKKKINKIKLYKYNELPSYVHNYVIFE